MRLQRLLDVLPPPAAPVNTFDGPYEEIEAELGRPLPQDYKDFWRLYGEGDFYSQFRLFHPLDLVEKAREAADILSWMELEGEGDVLWPEPGGRIPFGERFSGDSYCWKTQGEPDAWTVSVLERIGEWTEFGCSLTDYLAPLVDLDQAPDDWLFVASTLRGRGPFEPIDAAGREVRPSSSGPYRRTIRRALSPVDENSAPGGTPPPRSEMRILELVRQMSPQRPLYAYTGTWAEIEGDLNVRLPLDYKDFCRVFGTAQYFGWFTVYLPDSAPGGWPLTAWIAYKNELLRRAEGLDELGIAIWPAPGGLLYFGASAQKALFWKTDGAPEDWTVVTWAGGRDFESFDCDMTGFLIERVREMVYVYR